MKSLPLVCICTFYELRIYFVSFFREIKQGIRWRLKLTEPYLVNQSGHTDDGRGAALVTLTTAEGPLPDRSEWFREPETPSSTLKSKFRNLN